MKKILFISHEASRTGAPLVLLYFMEWLNLNRPEIQFDICSLKGGELLKDFRRLGKETIVIEEERERAPGSSFFGFGKSKIKNDEFITKKMGKAAYDIIFCNTVLSIPLGHKVKKFSRDSKLVVHVHELDVLISLVLPNLSSYTKEIDQFVAASNKVKEVLSGKYSVENNKVEVCYEFTKIPLFEGSSLRKTEFIVGGSGTVHWRKGTDIFLQIAKLFISRYPEFNIKFVWIGDINFENSLIFQSDIEKAGLKDKVELKGGMDNPFEEYQNFDLFLLTSREDPFPLVAIELGMMGKPIVCFEGTSGTEEVLKKGGGAVVPFLDIDMMCEKILMYHKDPAKLKEDGEEAKSLFSKFIPENQCQILLEILSKIQCPNH